MILAYFCLAWFLIVSATISTPKSCWKSVATMWSLAMLRRLLFWNVCILLMGFFLAHSPNLDTICPKWRQGLFAGVSCALLTLIFRNLMLSYLTFFLRCSFHLSMTSRFMRMNFAGLTDFRHGNCSFVIFLGDDMDILSLCLVKFNSHFLGPVETFVYSIQKYLFGFS